MVHGKFSDAQRSATRDATLARSEDGRWQLDVDGESRHFDAGEVEVSDRIGRIPRRLSFPGGAEFETSDNDGIDDLLGAREGLHARIVHGLERRWGVAVASLVGVALVTVFFIKVGLPAMAGWAADKLPPESDRLIGAQTLEILDRSVLAPSTLDAQRQAQLQNVFTRMTAPLNDGHVYQLELRSAQQLGPNALALPSGIIVMTDELVAVSKHDEEIMAVLAHEIGHVRGRHALRHIIQAAGVSMMAVVLLGDLSNVSALASAAPVLIQAKHSRDFEREADGFARGWLDNAGIPSHRFDDILCRMTGTTRGSKPSPSVFLSTHPDTTERVKCTAEAAPDVEAPAADEAKPSLGAEA